MRVDELSVHDLQQSMLYRWPSPTSLQCTSRSRQLPRCVGCCPRVETEAQLNGSCRPALDTSAREVVSGGTWAYYGGSGFAVGGGGEICMCVRKVKGLVLAQVEELLRELDEQRRRVAHTEATVCLTLQSLQPSPPISANTPAPSSQ